MSAGHQERQARQIKARQGNQSQLARLHLGSKHNLRSDLAGQNAVWQVEPVLPDGVARNSKQICWMINLKVCPAWAGRLACEAVCKHTARNVFMQTSSPDMHIDGGDILGYRLPL